MDPVRSPGAAPLRAAVLATVLTVLVLTACSTDADPPPPESTTTTVDPSDEAVPTGDQARWSEPENGRRRLVGFGAALATVTAADGRTCELCLMVARTPDQKTRGLMHVTDPDLGGHDGLVFVNDEPVTSRFWMRNTPLPLTAVFFDADGRYLDSAAMEPCPDDTADLLCPRHGPDEAHLLGVELAARTPAELLMEPGSVLTLTDRPCPAPPTGRTDGDTVDP